MEFWQSLLETPLYLDETDKSLEIDRAQVEEFYLPLAKWLLKQAEKPGRLLIGAAGPPGSGKTAFVSLLAAVINAQAAQEIACAVGMDGWHFSNAYLDSHSIWHGGERVSLRTLKGSPETFDVSALLTFLRQAREGGLHGYPKYSRKLHDPVPDAGFIREDDRIILVEGNYLFLQEPPWDQLSSLFDIRIFIHASWNVTRSSLEKRHLRGGKTPEFVKQHIQNVDLVNTERVLSGLPAVQVTVDKSDEKNIERISYG
jgi:putative kinase